MGHFHHGHSRPSVVSSAGLLPATGRTVIPGARTRFVEWYTPTNLIFILLTIIKLPSCLILDKIIDLVLISPRLRPTSLAKWSSPLMILIWLRLNMCCKFWRLLVEKLVLFLQVDLSRRIQIVAAIWRYKRLLSRHSSILMSSYYLLAIRLAQERRRSLLLSHARLILLELKLVQWLFKLVVTSFIGVLLLPRSSLLRGIHAAARAVIDFHLLTVRRWAPHGTICRSRLGRKDEGVLLRAVTIGSCSQSLIEAHRVVRGWGWGVATHYNDFRRSSTFRLVALAVRRLVPWLISKL